ncbi:MAG: LLM class flavin-dependent oxidoreductase [Candidatus Rokubacteria bacterium]|nr:LLM class flavin-dependent oxidoreductase [Candidatus Rokubacteria bacterium]
MSLTTGVLLLPSCTSDRLVGIAKLCERTGYDYLWLADERFFREVYALLALCAQATERLRLGPCVTDPYSRHPSLTAMAIATLDEISKRRAVLGIGAGVSGFRELGIAREKPAVAIREAVELIRRLLRGETVTAGGQLVRFHEGRLDFTPPRADVPVYVASQHEHGCRVAGRVADGAIMQGCVAPGLLAFFRDTVAEGARRSGRDPRSIDLVARINVCIADDRAAARDVMRPGIVRSLVSQRPEFFTFRTAGLSVSRDLAEKIDALSYTHDPAPLATLAKDVPDDFVDAVTLAGPPAVIADGVVRLARGGITQLMLHPMALDGGVERVIERFQAEVMPRVRSAGV